MKRRYFIPLLIVFALFGVFSAQKSARADTLYSQTGHATEYSTYDGYNNLQFLGNGLEGTINELCFWSSESKGNGADIYFGYQSTDPLNGANWSPEGYLYQTNSYASYPSSPQRFCVSIGDQILDPAKYYFLKLEGNYGYSFKDYGSNDSNSWATSSRDCKIANQGWANCGSIKDIYFELNGTPAPSDEVGFTFPENATSTPDFSHFRLNWNVSEEMTQRGIIIVNYSTDPDKVIANTYEKAYNCFYNINGCYRDVLVLENEMASSTDTALFKHFNLAPNLWYSHAELFRDYDAENWIFLASSTINFTITTAPQINTFWEIPTSTITTSTPAQITCDPDDPFFQYSFCKLFLYLLVPSSDAFDKFSTLGQEIENKPPIGYFTQIKSVLSNVNASGTPVFNIGNYSAFSGSIFTPLRTGISWLLWLFFAVVIFNRLRYLEL